METEDVSIVPVPLIAIAVIIAMPMIILGCFIEKIFRRLYGKDHG
jgi:hypothetical protein